MNLLLEDIKRSKYINFVPEYLRENENFLVYFYLLTREFDINFENIKNFTDLINNDKVPMKFLESLGAYMNYRYLPHASDEFNRELSMRMNTIWEQRGTKHAIIMAGTHGWNAGYVGGDIFVPGYQISNDYANLLRPREFIFRHSVSNFSGLHVYPNETLYRNGIFLLQVPYFDEEVRKRVYEVTQAGIKYLFEIVINFYPNPDMDPWDLGQWNELSFFKRIRPWPQTDKEKARWDADTDIDFTYIIDMGIKEQRLDVLIHSDGTNGKQNHSGPYKVMFDNILEFNMGVSSLPLPILYKKFKLTDEEEFAVPEVPPTDSGIDAITNTVNPDERTEIVTAIYDEFSSKRSMNGLMSGYAPEVPSPPFSEETYHEDETKEEGVDDRYIISETGEYLDRKDKKGSDSIIRDVREHYVDVELVREVRLTAIRSEFSSNRSEHGKQSGLIMNWIDNLVEESPMFPDDTYYSVDDVIELRPDEYRDEFFVNEIEYTRSNYSYYNQQG